MYASAQKTVIPPAPPANPPTVKAPPPPPAPPAAIPAPAERNAKEIYLEEHGLNSNDQDELIYNNVQVQPEFPGGLTEMYKFISENLQYPESAKIQKAEGKVIVQFIVEKDGKLSLIKIVRDGVGHGAAAEASRILMMMPKWKPGMENNQPVRVQYTLPFTFRLNK